jgi:CRISPR/Cas system-associated endoribonuclease Cas2
MPKRSSTKRLADLSEWAHQIVQESVDEARLTREQISRVMSAMGRRGGKIGGKRRLETMTREERSKIASNAAKKRWQKARNNGNQ